MYIVTVTFVVRPERIEDFRREMVANSCASREREPGCRQFDVAVDPADPTTIFLYEVYDDRAAFDAHLAAEHFKGFDALTRDWAVRKDVRVYARIDPV